MMIAPKNNVRPKIGPLAGRIDELGRVLLPVTIVASDGFELELEALVNLQFTGSLVIPEQLAASIGWRCLGARRVMMGTDIKVVSHYLGLVSLGMQHQDVCVLGGTDDRCVIGQRLLKGRELTVNFTSGRLFLSEEKLHP